MIDEYGISKRVESFEEFANNIDVEACIADLSDFSDFMIKTLVNGSRSMFDQSNLVMWNTYAMLVTKCMKGILEYTVTLKGLLENKDNPNQYFEEIGKTYREVATDLLFENMESRIGSKIESVMQSISEDDIEDESEIISKIMSGIHEDNPDAKVVAVNLGELLRQMSEEGDVDE